MTKEKKIIELVQLPKIIWHEPTKTDGWFEVRVPITWEDFMGIKKVKTVTTATLNIVDAIRAEYKIRLESAEIEKSKYEIIKKQEVEATAAKEKKTADAKKLKDRTIAITKIIKNEPDLVTAKRKEFGEDVLDDRAAGAIIYQDRQDPLKKPKDLPKSATTKKKIIKIPNDYTPDELPDGDYGEKVRFFKNEFGWSAYLDDKVWEDMIPILFEWLISIPMDVRHRKSERYPCISHSGKYLMINDYEKVFITTAAERIGMNISVKED